MPAHTLIAVIALAVCASTIHTAAPVEVTLVDRLDEPRSYCLDIVGSQRKATPERGLQAHTCYSYQGAIAVDQGFDAETIRKNEFRMPGFGVCMTLKSIEEGSSLGLEPCNARTEQIFELDTAGRITPAAVPGFCLTVAGGTGAPGGGGRPTHLLRKLTVERCAFERAVYQTWRLREKSD